MSKEITDLEDQLSNINDSQLAQFIVNITKLQSVAKSALEVAKKCGERETILHMQEKP